MMNMSVLFRRAVPCMVLFFCLGWVGPVAAFNPKHLDYNGCNTCHTLHSSPGGTLFTVGDKTEILCSSCHGPGGIIDTVSAAIVHNLAPVNSATLPGYVSCRECHDSHSNEYGNIKQVGYDWDPFLDPSGSIRYNVPTIREELTTSDYNSPVYKQVTFQDSADFNRGDGTGACEICHLAGPDPGTSPETDLADHQWGACVVCHPHEEGFKKHQCVDCHDVNATLSEAAPKVVDKGASSIGQVGSHLRISPSGDTVVGLTDREWTIQCIECHTGHSGDVIIPNNPAVGIDYPLTGGIGLGGNATDPAATSEAEICWGCHGTGQSEWNGQAYNGFSVSTEDWTTALFDAPGLIPTRPTRSIHTANEIDDPEGGDIEADVRSSSVADNVDSNGYLPSSSDVPTPNTNSEVLEKVKYIRCSYCHDVHDTVAGSPTKGDTVTAENGQTFTLTYLRGTWLPNPYTGTEVDGTTNAPEIPPWDQGGANNEVRAENNGWYYSSDGATDDTNVTRTTTSLAIGSGTHNNWGHEDPGSSGNPYRNFPRLFATSPGSNRMGGFFIDQNTGWPTRKDNDTYWSASEAAGLCLLCHDEGTDSLDYYQDSATLWRGSNGHSNSTVGGSGSAAADLFNARRDLANTDPFGMHGQPIPDTQDLSERQWGDNPQTFAAPIGTITPKALLPFGEAFNDLRTDVDGGSLYTPPFNTGWYDESGEGGKPRENSSTGDFFSWYNSVTIGVDGDGHGGADDRAHNFTCSKCHTPHASGLPALLITNCLDYQLSDWFTYGEADGNQITVGPTTGNSWALRAMGNCHRKDDNNSGWNRLSAEQ